MKKKLTLLLVLALMLTSVFVPSIALADDPEPTTYLVPGKTGDDVAVGYAIDLATEKLVVPNGFTVAAYNLGSKWVAGAVPVDAAFIRLLDKGMTLSITDKYDAAKKAPTVDTETPANSGVVVKFDKIEKRPAAPKLVAEYLAKKSADNAGADFWTFAKKDGKELVPIADADVGLYEYAASDANGKLPDTPTWEALTTAGIAVKAMSDAGKVLKDIKYVRTKPVIAAGATPTYTPMSKTSKVSASSLLKAPTFKADYKKEIIKIKQGYCYQLGTDETVLTATEDNAKKGLGIAALLSGADDAARTITIWAPSTDKKPATTKQALTLIARAAMTTDGLTVDATKGKATLDKKYEVLGKDSKGVDKWGSFPKYVEDGEKTYEIRLKSTAKVAKTGNTGAAASASGTLTVTWGDYPSGKSTKKGVLSAVITTGTPTPTPEPEPEG